MPELPEAETIKRGLNEQIKGFTITKVTPVKNYQPSHPKFSEFVEGSKILNAQRLGKIILISLQNPSHDRSLSLAFHLAMTGRLVVRNVADPLEDYSRLIFTLEKVYSPHRSSGLRSEFKELRYRSIRMFGYARLVDSVWVKKEKDRLGKEPSEFQAKELFERLKNKKTNIKNVLLDQSIISGLGNIYANEALWLAKVHPRTSSNALSLNQVKSILTSARKILREGIKRRGSTISDYVDSYGNPGKQQKHFRVYQKAGQNCPSCGTLIKMKKLSGRRTFFCPKCQELKTEKLKLI